MRYPIGLFLFLLAILSFSGNSWSQTLTATAVIPPADHNATLQVTGLPDYRSVVSEKQSFYEIFWIFGDGNYRMGTEAERIMMPIETPVPPIPTHNSGTINHCYKANTNGYIPMVLLIDRKSPPDDPPSVSIVNDSDNISGLGGCGTSSFTENISSGKKVDLDSSHFLRENRTTAFILSYKPEAQSKLLFFYAGGSTSATNFFDRTKTHIPNYYNATFAEIAVTEGSLSETNASELLIGPGPLEYEKVVIYDIPSTEVNNFRDHGPSELRFFHFLEANNDLPEGEEDTYKFLAILAGATQFTGTIPIEAQPFADPTNGKITRLGGNWYYMDSDIIEMQAGEPEDPNRIRVTDICKCPEDDDYEVTFELRFCNTQDAAAVGANIALYARRINEYSCIKIIDAYPESNPADKMGYCRVQREFRVTHAEAKVKFCRDEFELRNMTVLGEEGDCGFVIFTGKTKRENLGNLTTLVPGEFPFTACISFVGSDSNFIDHACGDSYQLKIDTTADPPPPFPPSEDEIIWGDRFKPCEENACKCPKFIVEVAQNIIAWAEGNPGMAFGFTLLFVILLVRPIRKRLFSPFSKK